MAARRILLVEDYQDTRVMYAGYLRSCGFQVVEAKDGLEAVDKAQHLLPDLILMDLALPQLDGCEATRRIKRDPKTRQIPIVAFTGFAPDSHAALAQRAGCDSFLAKPCFPDELVNEVNRLLATAEPGSAASKPVHRSR